MLKTYNILIVEDEWITANYITHILETLNQKIISVASSAKEAMECLKTNKIDFIYMDINIEGAEDGISLAHRIALVYKIPIIYMTAFGDYVSIEEASQTNIYGFIIKPFTERDIQAVLSVAIQRVISEDKYIEKKSISDDFTINLGAGYTFDMQKIALYSNRNYVSLSKNEAKLLCLLSSNQGDILSVETIRNNIWKAKDIGESTIRDTILRVRKKIVPLKLENVPSLGYILKKESE